MMIIETPTDIVCKLTWKEIQEAAPLAQRCECPGDICYIIDAIEYTANLIDADLRCN